MKSFPVVRNPIGASSTSKHDRTKLEAMIERYLGALSRGILTPEEALSNLRSDYAEYTKEK